MRSFIHIVPVVIVLGLFIAVIWPSAGKWIRGAIVGTVMLGIYWLTRLKSG